MTLNKIQWTPTALQDLENIRVYFFDNVDEETMASEARKIWHSCQRLKQFPESGRPGRVPMTREIIARPYVIPYRINGNTIEILNIFHEAQKR